MVPGGPGTFLELPLLVRTVAIGFITGRLL